MRNHHSTLGAVALALVLTLAGCSDDGTDPNGQDTATVRPSPTTPTSSTPPPKTDEDLPYLHGHRRTATSSDR